MSLWRGDLIFRGTELNGLVEDCGDVPVDKVVVDDVDEKVRVLDRSKEGC